MLNISNDSRILWRALNGFGMVLITLWASVLASLQSGSMDRHTRNSLSASSILPSDTSAWALLMWPCRRTDGGMRSYTGSLGRQLRTASHSRHRLIGAVRLQTHLGPVRHQSAGHLSIQQSLFIVSEAGVDLGAVAEEYVVQWCCRWTVTRHRSLLCCICQNGTEFLFEQGSFLKSCKRPTLLIPLEFPSGNNTHLHDKVKFVFGINSVHIDHLI